MAWRRGRVLKLLRRRGGTLASRAGVPLHVRDYARGAGPRMAGAWLRRKGGARGFRAVARLDAVYAGAENENSSSPGNQKRP